MLDVDKRCAVSFFFFFNEYKIKLRWDGGVTVIMGRRKKQKKRNFHLIFKTHGSVGGGELWRSKKNIEKHLRSVSKRFWSVFIQKISES